MNLPHYLVDEYTALIDRHLTKWRKHPEYDDLRATAFAVFWCALARMPAEKRYHAHALAVVNARHAVHTFLSSPACLGRNQNHRGRAVPVPWSWEELQQRLDQEPSQLPARLPYTEDFAPWLVERLWQQETLAAVRAECDPSEWEIVERWLLGGQSLLSLARERRCPAMTMHRRAQRLKERVKERFDAASL